MSVADQHGLQAEAVPPAELAALAAALGPRAAEIKRLSAVAGFDGFVDEMISVVGERKSQREWTRLESMAELGALVSAAAGRNSLREIVVRSQDAGGCAVNLGDGLGALGVGVDFFGTIGSPRHPAFDAFAAGCRTSTAIGRSYGRTLAFEFTDGKFMFSAVEQLGELTPELMRGIASQGAFPAACSAAGLIAVTNWTLYPHMTACWRVLQETALARISHRPWLFVDLVDPSSRAEAEVLDMLSAMSGFERTCRVVLGVNLTEADALSRVLGLGALKRRPDAVAARAAELRQRLGVSQVVVHNARLNAVADAEGAIAVAPGPFCASPRKTTGAGDRFNAGYCLGLLLGLGARQRLAVAAATSGFFIRAARSATYEDTVGFIADWSRGRVV